MVKISEKQEVFDIHFATEDSILSTDDAILRSPYKTDLNFVNLLQEIHIGMLDCVGMVFPSSKLSCLGLRSVDITRFHLSVC